MLIWIVTKQSRQIVSGLEIKSGAKSELSCASFDVNQAIFKFG